MPKVLVVEDDQRIAALVRHILEADGYQPNGVAGAEDAWKELIRETPDAAVIDLRLPGLDGFSLLERIRGDGRFHRLPVVILTAKHDPDVIQRATTLGAEYIGKPFSAHALMDKLRHAMERIGEIPLPPVKERAEMRTQGVVLLLGEYRVEGHVTLPSELDRFSDAWEAVVQDGRAYISLTDAKVERLDGRRIAESSFLQVRKADIRSIYPME
ncbi:MAG TPA: response regulator [Actinomycetota bacterium]|nr:response regulator [Actinomycetota bacterium]